jgi:hypothetical protein
MLWVAASPFSRISRGPRSRTVLVAAFDGFDKTRRLCYALDAAHGLARYRDEGLVRSRGGSTGPRKEVRAGQTGFRKYAMADDVFSSFHVPA